MSCGKPVMIGASPGVGSELKPDDPIEGKENDFFDEMPMQRDLWNDEFTDDKEIGNQSKQNLWSNER